MEKGYIKETTFEETNDYYLKGREDMKKEIIDRIKKEQSNIYETEGVSVVLEEDFDYVEGMTRCIDMIKEIK